MSNGKYVCKGGAIHANWRKKYIKMKQNRFKKYLNVISLAKLGSSRFKEDYNLKYAYLTRGMYHGIASKEMVVKMGKAGMLGFLGSGCLASQIKDAIQYIQKELTQGEAYGMDLLHNPSDPGMEEKTVDLFLEHGVRIIEASAFISIIPALVKYRAKGLTRNQDGRIITLNKIIANYPVRKWRRLT